MNLETRRSLFNGVFGLCILFLGMSFLELLLNYALNSRIRKQEAHLAKFPRPLRISKTTPEFEMAISTVPFPSYLYFKSFKCGEELTIMAYVNQRDNSEEFPFALDKYQEEWLLAELERRARCK